MWPLKIRPVLAGVLLVSIAFAKGHQPHPLIVKMDRAEALLNKAEALSLEKPESLRWDLKAKRFKSDDIEQARSTLRDLDGGLRQASEGVQSKTDHRLQVITPVSIRYLLALSRVLFFYTRAAHLPVRGTELAADLSAYSFDQVDTNLVLGKKAALAVISSIADAGFPIKARHYGNGTGANRELIELVLTEEQKQLAEFMALSRSPFEKPKKELNMLVGADSEDERPASVPPYSFASPEAYGKLIQFSAVRETLINRWFLNRILPKSVASTPIQSCGNQILSLRPGPRGSMNLSPAYSELAGVDRYQAYQSLVPQVVTEVSKKPLADAKTYGEIVLAVVKKIPDVNPAQTQYVAEHLGEIGALVVQGEDLLWQPKVLAIVQNSSLNGDDFGAQATSARIAAQVYEYRVDAVQKVIWENLRLAFPTANRSAADATVEAKLGSIRDGYLASVRAAIDPITKALESREESLAIRKQRFDKKAEGIFQAAKTSAQAAAELQEMIELDIESDDESPTPAKYRSTIEDPITLKLYFKVLEQQKNAFTVPSYGTREAIDGFFDGITRRYIEAAQKAGKRPPPPLSAIVSKEALEFRKKFPVPVPAKLTEQQRREIARKNMEKEMRNRFVAPRDATYVAAPPVRRSVAPWEAVGTVFEALNIDQKTFQVPNNRSFTKKISQQKVLAELLTMTAYNGAPALRIRTKVAKIAKFSKLDPSDGMAMKYGYVRGQDGKLHHETEFWPQERSLLENVAVASFDLSTGKLNEPKARGFVKDSLISAGVQAGGVVEEFCSANPLKYKTDVPFRNMFRAASALRSSIIGDSSVVRKLDEQVKRESRSTSEKILEDFIEPSMKYLLWVGIAALIVVSAGAATPVIAAMAPVFAASAAGVFIAELGALTTSAVFAVVSHSLAVFYAANLCVSVNVNLFELPPQIGFQSKLANSQLGDTDAVINWDEHLAAKKALGMKQFMTVLTAPLDALAIGGTVRAGVKLVQRTVLKSAISLPKTGVGGGNTGHGSSVVTSERGFFPSLTRPGAAGFQAVTGSRLLEFRKILPTLFSAGAEARIANFLEPYMESAITGLRREIDFYRSTLKPGFWEQAISQQGTVRLGKLPRGATAAARKGELQSWYDTSWGDLKPSIEGHVTSLEGSLQRLEGLQSKTKGLFLSQIEGDRVKLWADALTDEEIKALRGLVAQESVYGYHLPSLTAEDEVIRSQLFDQLGQGFKRAKFEFTADSKPGAASLYEGYWGQPAIGDLDRSVIRSDLSEYQRWLDAMTPSL